MGFIAGSAPKRPRLHNLGRVADIKEGKLSQSEKYFVLPIEIEGYGASRSLTVWFLWRPDWLAPGFDPATFDEMEGGKSYAFVYRSNISDGSGISLLEGLAGSKEAFNDISGRLQALTPEQQEDPAAIQAVFEQFFIEEENGQKVGYTMKQVTTKTDEVDKNGKPIYVRENRDELDRFWIPTETAINSRIASAAKNPETVKTLFAEDDVPF